MSALTVGCNQSLFDSDPDDEQNAGDGGSPPDSRVVEEDGGGPGGDGGGVDGRNMDVVDADIPAPLAIEYVETYDGPDDIQDVVMEMGTWNDLEAWVAKIPGTEEIRSAIVNCPASPESPYCAELPENALLFVSTNDTHRPAVRATTSATRVVVDYVWLIRQSALTSPAVLRIDHNGVTVHSDEREVLNELNAQLVTVNVVPDDVIHVVASPGASEGGQIGMGVQIFE